MGFRVHVRLSDEVDVPEFKIRTLFHDALHDPTVRPTEPGGFELEFQIPPDEFDQRRDDVVTYTKKKLAGDVGLNRVEAVRALD